MDGATEIGPHFVLFPHNYNGLLPYFHAVILLPIFLPISSLFFCSFSGRYLSSFSYVDLLSSSSLTLSTALVISFFLIFLFSFGFVFLFVHTVYFFAHCLISSFFHLNMTSSSFILSTSLFIASFYISLCSFECLPPRSYFLLLCSLLPFISSFADLNVFLLVHTFCFFVHCFLLYLPLLI